VVRTAHLTVLDSRFRGNDREQFFFSLGALGSPAYCLIESGAIIAGHRAIGNGVIASKMRGRELAIPKPFGLEAATLL